MGAVINRAGNARQLLDAVPQAARADVGYQFARIQFLRRNDEPREAARLMLEAPRDPRVLIAPDDWWTERRLLARRMLDEGDPRIAYRIAAGHAAQRDVEKMEAEFTAGWIALRFIGDAETAERHFRALQQEARRKILGGARGLLARPCRGGARLLGRPPALRTGGALPTTYYGQLALAKLGQTQIELRGPRAADAGARHASISARPCAPSACSRPPVSATRRGRSSRICRTR